MINTIKQWSWDDMRAFCIRHNYFNAGSNRQYDDLAETVNDCEPTKFNIRLTAKMIQDNTRQDADIELETIVEGIESEVVREIPDDVEEVSYSKYQKALDYLRMDVQDYLDMLELETDLIEVVNLGSPLGSNLIDLGLSWQPDGKQSAEMAVRFSQAVRFAAELVNNFRYNGYRYC